MYTNFDLIPGHDVPMVLVGNKLDCSHARTVAEIDATEAANTKQCAYVETSAKNRTNVQDVFMALLIKALIPDESELKRQDSGPRRLARRIGSSIKVKRSNSTGSNKSDESCQSQANCMKDDDSLPPLDDIKCTIL